MGTNVLVDVDKKAVAPKKRRERIQLIETRPSPEWFQQATDPWGRRIWFLRVQSTGLRVRRYGPFSSKHKALLFLDRLINEMADAFAEAANHLDTYMIKPRQFAYRGAHYPMVEDELAGAVGTKGR